MANDGEGSTLRFTCNECGTHLGVDESLAGTEAPCPKCGTVIVAPGPKSQKDWAPSSGVIRGVAGGAGFQADPRERAGGAPRSSGDRSSSRDSSDRMKSRKVVPGSGSMPSETRTVIKIMIAVALAVFVVVLVTWFLKNQ